MNEIEKLYENAEIKEYCSIYETNKQCEGMVDCSECASTKYPLFTPEKQLELIKWLAAQAFHYILGRINGLPTFEASLARLINHIWQALTEEEKRQIKEILE